MKQVFFLFLIFVNFSVVYANSDSSLQDSLYKEALNAEEREDFSLALELFSKAYEAGGIYETELAEIISDYSLALQEQKNWHFLFEGSGKGEFFKESEGTYFHKEFLGGLNFKTKALREFNFENSDFVLGGALSGTLFILPEETYLDTSNFYLLPELEAGFSSNGFLAHGTVGAEIRESDVNLSVSILLEKFFFENKKHRLGTLLESSFLQSNFLRSEFSLVHSYDSKNKFSSFWGVGIRSTLDSVFQTQNVHFVAGDTVQMMHQPMPPMDSILTPNFPPMEGDVYELKGKIGHLFGPQLFFISQFDFQIWYLDFSSKLFFGNEVYLKNFRNLLDLDLTLKASVNIFNVTLFAGTGLFYRHYFIKNECYRLTIPEDRLFVNLFLGVKKEF